ncbi:MAG: PDZ domain-containing protein [Pseudomonadota bacterium]
MKRHTTLMSAVLLAAAAGVTGAQQPTAPPAPDAPRAPALPPAPAAPPAEQADVERQLDAARERLDVAAREVAELSNRLGERIGDSYMRRDMRGPRVVLGLQIDNKTGAGGAPILAVSPGGAADKAGLKAGDVIVAIAGEDLARHASPGRALVEAVRKLQPDLKVKLRVLTAGKTREVEVLPRVAPPGMMARGEFNGPMPGAGGRIPFPPRPPGMPGDDPGRADGPGRGPVGGPMGGPGGAFAMQFERGNFAGMELATLTPRLGSYFGAKDGVLVVRSGNSAFQLEDGDVITAIDGRAPKSAAHATRILRSYQRGEKLVLRVMRDRKARTLEVTIAGG